MALNNQITNLKCKCCKGMEKQQIINQPKISNELFNTYKCQPILFRHHECIELCLNFKKRTSIFKGINLKIPKIEPMPLKESKLFISSIIEIEKQRNIANQNIISIVELQKLKYKNNIIGALLGITPSQVRQNGIRLQIINQKYQIIITRYQQEWLIEQASQQSNRILFNASFLCAFREQFPKQILSTSQFRKILKTLVIRYRIPSLKPYQFCNKNGKREEMKKFISLICGYVSQNYKLIFIDECSFGNISKPCHQQWHVLGTFKETTQRISNSKYLIGSIGDDGFLYYQLFSGTGKGDIFQDFLIEILHKAQIYYKDQHFALVLDNCSIHKSSIVMNVLAQILCIFTPAYRPEFNAIDHMFGWIKRKPVNSQPSLHDNLYFKFIKLSINSSMI